jgi:hypothetical protein
MGAAFPPIQTEINYSAKSLRAYIWREIVGRMGFFKNGDFSEHHSTPFIGA